MFVFKFGTFLSQGVGIWYVYPDLPTGPSRALDFMAKNEAKHTPIELFENNVAHSYVKVLILYTDIY